MAIMFVCTAVLSVVQIQYHGYPKVGYQNFGNSFSPASGVPIPLVGAAAGGGAGGSVSPWESSLEEAG